MSLYNLYLARKEQTKYLQKESNKKYLQSIVNGPLLIKEARQIKQQKNSTYYSEKAYFNSYFL
jgi:hypothetical protein